MSDGKLRALVEARDQIRLKAVNQRVTGNPGTYENGYFNALYDTLQQIEAALSAADSHLSASSNEGWRDIASAPTNKAILILVPNLDYYGNQGVYAGMLVDMGTGPRWMTSGWAIGRDLGSENKPTRWRPLPPPPSPGEEQTPQSMEQGR